MIEKRELEKAMREWRKEVCFGNLDKKLKQLPSIFKRLNLQKQSSMEDGE